MTCEEYIVRRLQDIEEENHGLWGDIDHKNCQITELKKAIKFLTDMIRLEEFKPEGVDEKENLYKMDNVWESFDKKNYNRISEIKELVDRDYACF